MRGAEADHMDFPNLGGNAVIGGVLGGLAGASADENPFYGALQGAAVGAGVFSGPYMASRAFNKTSGAIRGAMRVPPATGKGFREARDYIVNTARREGANADDLAELSRATDMDDLAFRIRQIENPPRNITPTAQTSGLLSKPSYQFGGVAKNFAAPAAATGLLALGANRDEAEAMPRARVPKLAQEELQRLARAKAQGFDTKTPLYHGTRTAGFDTFDLSRADPLDGGAIFTSTDPNIANNFAYGGRAAVMPLYARGNIKSINAKGKQFDQSWMGDQIERAKQEGFDGLRIKRLREEFGTADQVAIFDPKNVASRFDMFDPPKKLDWSGEEARIAEREARRAKGAVLRGDIAQSSADAREIFGDRLNFPGDDELVVARQQRGPIPHVTRPGRLAPGSIKLEALAKLNEHPTITRPGMPEGAHAIDPTYLGKTLGGGAAIAGGATGLFGPSLTDALKHANIENDAISTDRRTMQRLADAMGLDLANTKSAPSMGAAPDGVYRASLPEVLAVVTDQRGPVTRDDFAAANAMGRAVELGAQLRQAGQDTKEGFAKKPLRTALDVSSWLPIIGYVTGPVSMALDLLSGKNHAPAPSDLQGVKRWAAMTPSQKYNRIQQGYVDDRDPRFAFMPPLTPNSSPYFVPELPFDYGQRRQLPR